MQINETNLKKAWELLSELEKLEEARGVTGNYDAKVYATFSTVHNYNAGTGKKVQITMPPDITKLMNEYISNRIFEIKKELESL